MKGGENSNTLICARKTRSRSSRRFLRTFCIFSFLLLIISSARAQQAMDYAVHANIIYHFTKYINWPDDKKSGDFVIGVIGDSPLFEKLKNLIGLNKVVGSQHIVIRKISPSAQSFNCHILFIGEDESSSLKKIASGTASSSILLVTESEGLARKGSCINFIIADDRLKLEINKKNIEQRDLGIATELLNLGTVVK
jgi:hypothetical protein